MPIPTFRKSLKMAYRGPGRSGEFNDEHTLQDLPVGGVSAPTCDDVVGLTYIKPGISRGRSRECPATQSN